MKDDPASLTGGWGASVLDDDGATLLLDRAAQLDAGRGRTVELADLRDAALEAGISGAAFDRALAELNALRASGGHTVEATAADVGSGGRPAVLRRWLATAARVAVGLGLGFLPLILEETVGLDGEAVTAFSAIVALQLVLFSLIRRRKGGDVAGFEMDSAGLWAGFTFGLMASVSSFDQGEVVLATTLGWLLVAAIGGAVIGLAGHGKRAPAAPAIGRTGGEA